MPKNNYILTSNGELYHSSEHRKTTANAPHKAANSGNKVHVLIHGQLMEVDEDTLMHWKYIKREWKNGRWVYTYDESSLEDVKKKADEADGMARSYHNESANAARFGRWEQAHSARKMSQDYFDRSERLLKEYNNKMASSFLERTIAKGVAKIADFFSRALSGRK